MSINVAAAAIGEDPFRIAPRMERLPISPWHTKLRLVIGSANFFDAFNALSIAYVLPVLIPLWHLAPSQIGTLIAIGYAGQVIGGVSAGWFGEKFGRVPVAITTLLIFTLMSFACVLATSYTSLLWLRFVQGVGLGGEVPIMNTYVNEFAKAERRGRFSLVQQMMFPLGLTTVALAGLWVVPHMGWQWLFVLGGVPALLVLPMRRTLPESPRWLASRGRYAEADRVLTGIEDIISEHGAKPLPPPRMDIPPALQATTRIGDLFRGVYLQRTLSLWGLWFCTYIITYALLGWLPSIFRTVFGVSVETAILYGFGYNVAGLLGAVICAYLIDVTGRKTMFAAAFLVGGLPLLAIWALPHVTALNVLALTSLSVIGVSITSIGMGMYTAENYPTQMRALGSGVASVSQRSSSVVGPYLIGALLPTAGVGAVFALFGGFSLVGFVICVLFSLETRGKALEQLSPVR